jgi:hypothetical protein
VSRTIQDEHNEDGEETMAVTDESMDAPTTTITATDSVEDSGTSLPTPTGSLFVETTIITTTRLPNLSTGSASSISPSPFPSAVPHAPFTRQEKHISFGIGIGIGAPIAIALGIIAFLFWRRHRRASTNANTAATLADAHPSRPRRFRRLSVLSLVTRRSSRATRAADSAVVSTPTSASTHEKPPSELHGSDHQPYELQSREISELP